ncbi:YbaB/EbfC family nucleoid-associated protein [Rhodovibrio sodomensis]|jgi:hypothetical protein|uniref:Nucleoid-associated protein CKO28_27020 n=1 Tax=Rhodovibrio sodomensis TaxID=1088 RepID=A0ABS1DQM9_9PROT|nr:YbaB/EbfC family nucleoid-associated protein [Rhodovibrio sodomensis]MBK1671645.1 YbaB/EbfC family nucleoid-associated protein [Rhodovibrio sodomensis]
MKNLSNMMKQAQQMQEKMQEMQERLAQEEITGSSGGGMVQVTITGKGQTSKVSIDPSLIDPNEPGVLEDLIAAANNDARQKLDEYTQQQMSELTGGMDLPAGFKLPGM